MKMTKKILISGKIVAKTGLHIGGTNVGMSIGSTDNTVVRNPITNEPYVPGSSIRGKMRSLLERLYGEFTEMKGSDIHHGPLTNKPDHIICKVFGMPAEAKSGLPPSRVIVRDGQLINRQELEAAQDTDMPFTEIKTEVVIDRVTSFAMPRQLERVPAGAEFGLEMVLNIWEGDNEQEMLDLLFKGLILVQNDYLGGYGGRGSGQVKVVVHKLQEKTMADYNAKTPWRDRQDSVPRELHPEANAPEVALESN